MNKLQLLLPLDSTEYDASIVQDVSALFDPKSFSLNILHVTAIPDMTWRDYDDLQKNSQDIEGENLDSKLEYNQQAKNLEKHLLTELEETKTQFEAKGFEVNCNIAFGEAAKEIIKFVDTKNLDVIIMSKHNRKSLPRLNMGSVTTKVLNTAKVPVLLLKPINIPTEVS